MRKGGDIKFILKMEKLDWEGRVQGTATGRLGGGKVKFRLAISVFSKHEVGSSIRGWCGAPVDWREQGLSNENG